MTSPAASPTLVIDTVRRAASFRERTHRFNPVALYLGNQFLHLDLTPNPLLACLLEHRVVETFLKKVAPGATPQMPLAVLYLIAMAQKWLSAVPEDQSVRVWVVATKLDETAQIYWSEVHREGLQNLDLVVERSEVFRQIPCDEQEREMFMFYVAGIHREVWDRATPEVIDTRFPPLTPYPMCLQDEVPEFGDGYVLGEVQMDGTRLLNYHSDAGSDVESEHAERWSDESPAPTSPPEKLPCMECPEPELESPTEQGEFIKPQAANELSDKDID